MFRERLDGLIELLNTPITFGLKTPEKSELQKLQKKLQKKLETGLLTHKAYQVELSKWREMKILRKAICQLLDSTNENCTQIGQEVIYDNIKINVFEKDSFDRGFGIEVIDLKSKNPEESPCRYWVNLKGARNRQFAQAQNILNQIPEAALLANFPLPYSLEVSKPSLSSVDYIEKPRFFLDRYLAGVTNAQQPSEGYWLIVQEFEKVSPDIARIAGSKTINKLLKCLNLGLDVQNDGCLFKLHNCKVDLKTSETHFFDFLQEYVDYPFDKNKADSLNLKVVHFYSFVYKIFGRAESAYHSYFSSNKFIFDFEVLQGFLNDAQITEELNNNFHGYLKKGFVTYANFLNNRKVILQISDIEEFKLAMKVWIENIP
jgi:hypothetical protein